MKMQSEIADLPKFAVTLWRHCRCNQGDRTYIPFDNDILVSFSIIVKTELISFKHEYRRMYLLSRCVNISDVINMKFFMDNVHSAFPFLM